MATPASRAIIGGRNHSYLYVCVCRRSSGARAAITSQLLDELVGPPAWAKLCSWPWRSGSLRQLSMWSAEAELVQDATIPLVPRAASPLGGRGAALSLACWRESGRESVRRPWIFFKKSMFFNFLFLFRKTKL